jgi:hypothetical protein
MKSLRPYSAAKRYEKVNVGMGYSLMTPQRRTLWTICVHLCDIGTYSTAPT